MHRCLPRQGILRSPQVDGGKPAKKKFKRYPNGYFHIDSAEVWTAQGKRHLFVAIDQTSKWAFVKRHEKAPTPVAAKFLNRLIEAAPDKIHTVLTDNALQFTPPGTSRSAVALIKEAVAKGEGFGAHAFEYAKANIDHRTTKPEQAWINAQVQRVNRTLKKATVKRFHSDEHHQLRWHLDDLIAAYSLG